MKNLFLFALALLAFWLPTQAQNQVWLQLEPRLGANPFAMNTPISAGSYEYKITRLEYYISEIKIIHDGGQTTPATDVYLLVKPEVDTLYDLGSFPNITNVESITFSVGVDEPHNHLDPATYPFKHPLGPQSPSMHWGWASGYRFVAIEGKAGNNFINDFEVHTIGDANYKTLTIQTAAVTDPNGDKVIPIVADYAEVLYDIDVSLGIVVHSSSGKAITLMNNMRDRVFSAATSATLDPAFEGAFAVSPNPAIAGRSTASMSLPAGYDYRISLTDLTGRVILNQPLESSAQTFAFENQLNPGVYLAQLWQNERPVAVEKLIVVQ